MKFKTCMLLTIACSFTFLSVSSQAHNSSTDVSIYHFDKDSDFVELRKAHMHLIGVYFGQMGEIVKGKRPYDEHLFSVLSDHLVTLSKWAPEGFVENHLTSESKSKPAIWNNTPDFNTKFIDFQTQAKKIQTLVYAKSNFNVIKSAFEDAGGTCGACHKKYKFK